MTKELFQEYNELEQSIRLLKEQQDGLRKKIVEELVTDDVAKVQTDFGTFSRIPKKTYEYPEEVTNSVKSLKKEITKVQAQSVAQGTASVEIVQTLRFTPNKITEI